MARAKRTARADARRRHRAEQGLVDAPLDPVEPVPTPTSATGAKPATAAPGGRRSIATAFRESFRPLDVRGDIQALPSIAIHSKALWVPILLTLASTALFIAVPPTSTGGITATVSAFLFSYFVVTPAIGAVFLAGFLAPRASWLLGVIVGLVSAACYSFLGLAGFIPQSSTVQQPPAGDIVLASFTISPFLGAFFASAAAWYRRFLMLSNPNRGRARQSTNAGRRPDGRSRTTGTSQKAGVRR